MRKIVSLLAGVALLAGCSVSHVPGTTPSETFQAKICAEGAVVIPCRALGEIKIPQGGESLAQLVVLIAGPYLTKQANLKACAFTTYPESVGRAIVVTATAACTANGVPVQEKLTLTLEPVIVAG